MFVASEAINPLLDVCVLATNVATISATTEYDYLSPNISQASAM